MQKFKIKTPPARLEIGVLTMSELQKRTGLSVTQINRHFDGSFKFSALRNWERKVEFKNTKKVVRFKFKQTF